MWVLFFKVQVKPVPVQSFELLPLESLQPAKVEPTDGAAVKVILVPLLNPEEEHVRPQLIPAGLLVTKPVPVPALIIVTVVPAADACGTPGTKNAITSAVTINTAIFLIFL
jgi:hypothetical protein